MATHKKLKKHPHKHRSSPTKTHSRKQLIKRVSIISINGRRVKQISLFLLGICIGALLLLFLALYRFDTKYQQRVYPGISSPGYELSGKTQDEIVALFKNQNNGLENTSITLTHEDVIATISAEQLEIMYDGKLAATQALSVGRSGNITSDFLFKVKSWWHDIVTNPKALVTIPNVLTYKSEPIDDTIEYVAQAVYIPAIEPLYEYDEKTERVKGFELGTNGRALDEDLTKELIDTTLTDAPGTAHALPLPVKIVEPKTSTEDVDNLGIVDHIGHGESYYRGSIPGRVHNVILAADRASGTLIPPGETYSFNDTVGDISAATGYQTAYVIKNGRTVLGDGGGVCQVSTTVFRAALDAGLEILEREPHSYRVSYYEQGGYQPGLDATIYSPTTDLKVKNNTGNYILVQSTVYQDEQKLVFDIYGKDDGREVYVGDITTWDPLPPPPPVYQDDPTLAPGEVKQVDWAASGIKATFDYKVVKDGQVLQETDFYSNFRPWQAVYLKGPDS